MTAVRSLDMVVECRWRWRLEHKEDRPDQCKQGLHVRELCGSMLRITKML